MATIESLKKQTLDLMHTIQDISAATSVLNWDQETYMPSGASAVRAEQISTLSTLAHQLLTGDKAKSLASEISFNKAETFKDPILRLFVEDHEESVKLPEDLVRRTSKTQSLAQDIWKEARSKSDFSLFAPILSELIELKKEEADCRTYVDSRYDALLNIFEPGITAEQLNPIFDNLRISTKKILDAIEPVKHTVSDAPMMKLYEANKQMEFSKLIAEKMGFNFNNGRLDLTAHPFCTSFTQYDVRLTTRIKENDLASCLYGVIHETGHGLYEQGFSPEYTRTFVANGASIGMHESQSLLWETIITRTEEFWHWALPIMSKIFPEQTIGLTAKDM